MSVLDDVLERRHALLFAAAIELHLLLFGLLGFLLRGLKFSQNLVGKRVQVGEHVRRIVVTPAGNGDEAPGWLAINLAGRTVANRIFLVEGRAIARADHSQAGA